jgi:G3E family GTPase
MNAAPKTPVYLLTGFLGSGKTTLLNTALRAPELANTAVVVNELGDIGLDNLIIAQASDNVVLLDAGCLCCVNAGALQETLADLAFRRSRGDIPAFERVIIETSGAADPAPPLSVLLGHPLVTAEYRLTAVVCAVDAQHFLAARKEHPELDKQAAVAERIVVTKRDLADPEPVLSFLRELNPAAAVVESAADAFAPADIERSVTGSLASRGPIRAQSPHSSGIEAFSFRLARPVSWAGWAAWSSLVAAKFGPRLIRIKGLMRMADTDEIIFVQGVQGVFHAPQRFRDWPGEDRSDRLVCIASDIGRAEIEATLPILASESGIQAAYSPDDLPQRKVQQ